MTGAQELDVAAVVAELSLVSNSPIAMARHGAGAIVGSGAGSITNPSEMEASAEEAAAVRPEPPVSSTLGGTPPPTRVNVNFGQTFSDESNVVDPIVIEPVEALKSDRFTWTFHCSEPPPV